MVKIYSPIILVLAFSVGVLLLFRNSRYRAMAGARCRLVPTILLSFSILVLTGLLSESMTTDRLQSEMWMTLFILNILTWQRMEIRYVLNICRGCIALYCLMIIYNLCIWSGLLNAFPSSVYQWLFRLLSPESDHIRLLQVFPQTEGVRLFRCMTGTEGMT